MSDFNPDTNLTNNQESFIDQPSLEDTNDLFDDEPSFNENSTMEDDNEFSRNDISVIEEDDPPIIEEPQNVASGNVEDPTKASQILGISPEDVQQRNESNAGLLRLMEGNINEIMDRLQENDQLINQIANTVMMLKESVNKCNQDIMELRSNLSTNVPESIRIDYEKQINSLKDEKEETRNLIQVLSSKMREVNAKVKAQSDQLNMIKTAGAKGCDYKSKLSKLNKMKRSDLDKIAKKWGLSPESYPRKTDLLNALQLIGYASMLKLNKRPKEELVILAKNLRVNGKTKKDLANKLEKKISNVKI